MELYVIDPFKTETPHFQIVGIIPSYYSLIWNPQLYGLGYFEVTVSASKKNMSLLKGNRFLVREVDIYEDTNNRVHYRNAMIIRDISITYDADHGYLMTVSGKSIKDILSQRIVWDQYSADNKLVTDVISELLYSEVIDPEDATSNRIDALEEELQDLDNQAYQAEQNYEDAEADYAQAVQQYGADSPQAKAIKEEMDAYKAEYDRLTAEIDKKMPVLVYYQNELDLQASRQIPYISANGTDPPEDPPSISVQLRGENLGEWMEEICTENHIGWYMDLTESTMYFKFKEGQDVSEYVIFSPEFDNLVSSSYKKSWETYRNAALVGGEGEGLEQKVENIGTSSSFNRYEEYINGSEVSTNDGEISDAYYRRMLKQYGQTAIIPLKNKESIEADIDTDGVFKIGEDFDLGDIVKVEEDHGISSTVKLVEIIYSDESSGTKTTGVFNEWEV